MSRLLIIKNIRKIKAHENRFMIDKHNILCYFISRLNLTHYNRLQSAHSEEAAQLRTTRLRRFFYLPGRRAQRMAEYTQEYIQTITTVEDMPIVAKEIVADYCARNDIDEKDIYPTIWNDIISELYFILFKPCHKLLKIDNTQYNEYDRIKVYYVYEYIYKRLCNSHCQEITQKGFLDMTGIDKQTLYNWKNDNKYIYNINTNSIEHNNSITNDNINNNNNMGNSDVSNNSLLSSSRFDLQQKIMDDNEESLFALMKDRRNNPMKYLPKLNKVHNWNMPGVSSRNTEKQSLSASALPKLGGEIVHIAQNDGVKTDD